jgi:hypothetical protein
MTNLYEDFASLFAGNLRSFGQWDPDNGNMSTEKLEVNIANYNNHLNGIQGLGIVPITDGGTVHFGCIDVDNHGKGGDGKDLDLVAIAAAVENFRLPLVVTRSKSGGAHLYLFGSEPLPAKLVIRLLNSWRDMLAFPNHVDIFPKQDSVVTKSGEKSLGNWINLPYFDAEKTVRYGVNNLGERLDFELFISLAQGKKVTVEQLQLMAHQEHLEAPPCIQKMIHTGVESGSRNDAMYNVVIYLKRSRPDTFFDDAMDLNRSMFDKPLGNAEAKKVIRSASRRDYLYKCSEEPCKSLCDRKVCITREHGISTEESKELDAQDSLPGFTELIEYKSEPPRWGIHVNGTLIPNIPTIVLRDPALMGTLIFEVMKINIPKLSQDGWRKRVLDPLIPTLRTIEVPKEASASGIIAAKFNEFVQKADLTKDGTDIEERKALTRNIPVVQVINGQRCIVFRGTAFSEFLKRNKAEVMTGMDLWIALRRDCGADHDKMRIPGGKPINIWYAPITEDHEEKVNEPRFKSEF